MAHNALENPLKRLRTSITPDEYDASVSLPLPDSLNSRLTDLDQREKAFIAFSDSKIRQLAIQERQLTINRQQFLDHCISREEELNRAAAAKIRAIRIHIKSQQRDKLNQIRSQQRNLRSIHKSLAQRERNIDTERRALDNRNNDFKHFLEGKMAELASKENKLTAIWQEFMRAVKLAEDHDKFRECDGLGLRHVCVERSLELLEDRLESLRAMVDRRFSEIEHGANVLLASVERALREADLIREFMEKQQSDFNEMTKEFYLFQKEKMQELVSKEKQLDVACAELAVAAKVTNNQLMVKAKLGHELLDRLELAQNNVEGLKKLVDERFKEIKVKDSELNSLSDWIEMKMDEADSQATALLERMKRVKTMEEYIVAKDNELQKRVEELDLKEKHLSNWQRELQVKEREVDLGHEYNEKRMEELDWKEKNLNSVKDFTRNCFKEHRAIKKQLQCERETLEKQARELKDKAHQLDMLELKLQQLNDDPNANANMDSHESPEIKFIVRMDGKALQMFLSDPGKDLDSMGDEVFKVLHLSPDPAKLVLDAMVDFYTPLFRPADVSCKVREACILLLEQLTKMLPKIQLHVQEEAIGLANEWKSKMSASAEHSLEVLGFLHLLAAYNLVTYFDRDEISRFLMIVWKHRQAAELHRVLGST